MVTEASLYFHIPFCTKKCDYCHFYVLPDKDPFKRQLMEGFLLEWEQQKHLLDNHKIVSVYFGGGTPALMGPKAIGQILSWLPLDACSEITLEANPENITYELMKGYADAGINRVSIGVQTFDDELLKFIGRTHDSNKAKEAVYHTKNAGIHNISIDLMYDIPRQTVQQWENTVIQASQLPITHLSLYNLTIEPHTVFYKKQDELRKQLPDEEASLQMYTYALEMFEKCGLERYEISAFSRNNQRSLHNTGYWQGRPFLGFGPSAFSYWKGKRFRNIANLNKYCSKLAEHQSPVDFEETLDPHASHRELLAIGIRLKEGVPTSKFDDPKLLSDLVNQGFVEIHNSHAALTHKGILFYDLVAELIII